MYCATADEMEKLDDVAVKNGLEIRQMMELAGFHMVRVFQSEAIQKNTRIVIVAGKGNKGGDGLSAARHLVNQGYSDVSVILAVQRDELKHDPAHHLNLLFDMDVSVYSWQDEAERAHAIVENADVVVDSLLGYHLDGPPRPPYDDIIRAVTGAPAVVVSYDMPSGVNATTGECLDPCVRADATLTLALPKRVFDTEAGAAVSGRVYIGDIGIPSWMYKHATGGRRPAWDEGGVQRII